MRSQTFWSFAIASFLLVSLIVLHPDVERAQSSAIRWIVSEVAKTHSTANPSLKVWVPKHRGLYYGPATGGLLKGKTRHLHDSERGAAKGSPSSRFWAEDLLGRRQRNTGPMRTRLPAR